MSPGLERQAWLSIVKPEELDIHMASVGQAETNAGIVKEMFACIALEDHARLLVHGCGSCQMLDYLSLSEIGNVDFTFADLSPAMAEEGKRRLAGVSGAKYNLVVDDIEQSTLSGSYDAVLLVLVLLHVDWRVSLENMMRLGVQRFYIIEQEQGPGVSPITHKEKLLPSMERYSAISEMSLVPRLDLVAFMEERGYTRRWTTTHPVPGDKAMAGFVFERNAQQARSDD